MCAEVHAIDLATELHLTPGVTVIAKGGSALLNHLRQRVVRKYASCSETKFVGVCYDAPHFMFPIKAQEQDGHKSNAGTGLKRLGPTSTRPLSGASAYQEFLRTAETVTPSPCTS